MKKNKPKIIIISSVVLAIIALTVFSFVVFYPKYKDKQIITKLSGIVSGYDVDSTLSFENYLTNTTMSAVENIDENYYLTYQNKNICISNQKDVSICKKNNKSSFNFKFDCFEEMKSCKELEVGNVVYLKSFYKSNKRGESTYTILETEDENGIFAKLDNGLFAKLEISNCSVSVNQLGAYGDGINDDSTFINNAIKLCNEKGIINLVFENGIYLSNDFINVRQINNLRIFGNNSTILVSNDFLYGESGEFFFNVFESKNILVSNLKIKYDFSKTMRGIKTQFVINKSTNIEVFGCEFLIEKSLRDVSECGYTNFDCYSNWQNIIINNCNFVNLCDNEEGGGIWIRDLHNLGSNNLKLINSKFRKISHDEILAVFMGQIKDVLISSNTFDVPDNGNSSSVMNFTLGSGKSVQAENIIFENNTINTCSTGGLIWSKNTKNLIVRNNKIKITLSSKADGENKNNHFRIFESQSSNSSLCKIELIENNDINIYSNKDSYNFQFKIFSQIKNVENNTITVYTPVTNIFINCDTVKNNSLKCHYDVDFVAYNILSNFSNNNITLVGKTSCLFRWYGASLENEVICNGNKTFYSADTSDDCFLIMINGSKFNGNLIKFEENVIEATKTGRNSRILFIAPDDENEQQFLYTNNQVSGFPENRNYIKNATIITEQA